MTTSSVEPAARTDVAAVAGCSPWPAPLAARYRADGHWAGETFGEALARRARLTGSATAVVDSTRRFTFAELDSRANSLAAGLRRLGVRFGDRVVVHLPNVVEFFDVCFALFRLGAVPVAALPAFRSREIEFLCRFSEATAYVTTAQVAPVADGSDAAADPTLPSLVARLRRAAPGLRHVLLGATSATPSSGVTALSELYLPPEDFEQERDRPRPRPDDLAVLQVASSATRNPMLVPRTHDDYLCAARCCIAATGLTSADVYLAVLPVAHNFALVSPGVFGAVVAGATSVLAPLASPDAAFPLVAAERVTVSSLPPPLARLWATVARSARHDLSSLRLVQIGGARCEPELAAEFTAALRCQVQQAYGMAEGLISFTDADAPEEVVRHTQGRPVSAADEVRVVDPAGRDAEPGGSGELLARGPYTVRGYWTGPDPARPAPDVVSHNSTVFTDDGYFRTGDVVVHRPDGHLVVVGRTKNLVNRGGEKVAAAEVEALLRDHPAVRDARVVALPDAFLGERVLAHVVLADRGLADGVLADAPSSGQPPLRPQDLLRYLRGRGVAGYKVPDRLRIVDQLPGPVSGTGRPS